MTVYSTSRGASAFAPGRQALEGHAFFQFRREQRARLQEDQLVVVVAEGFLGLQVQVDPVAGLVALQGLLDLRQQVVAAHQELHRLVKFVQHFAQRIFQRPGQRDHALLCDFHMTIVAPLPCKSHQTLPLLGGLSPQQFMSRHWQKKPLLVRGAVPDFQPLLSRSELFALSGREEVESRLVAQTRGGWSFRRGPFQRRALPPLSRPGWTLLVQGVDLHDDRAHELLSRFRFVPQARLDDLMISYASDGGGVGPHFDSYDVFLLQAQGRRRWRIGRQYDLTLRDDLPLKVLANFEPEEECVLEPGDMLYLPPLYAHDGVASGRVP